MRLGVLTSVDIRHRYLVQALRSAFPVVAVGYEETGFSFPGASTDGLDPVEQETVSRHYSDRTSAEQKFYGHNCAFVAETVDCATLRIPTGALNTAETLHFLERTRVEAVVVYGTNLIKAALLDRWPGRMINMHLGLSPYYRGIATNFYPLLNEEPEYVGATIHLIDPGVDSGPILRHARPDIVADDTPHTIGCKAILAGISALKSCLRDIAHGNARPVQQWPVPNARFYRRKDYNHRQVVELYRKIETGLIAKYVEHAAEVAPRVRLVQ